MAEYLASIYGTEKDKVNCSFYFKIGACRHGERCSRKHVKPTFSQTMLIANMYRTPAVENPNITPEEDQDQFDLFYEDVFTELASFGEVEEMIVCDNVGDHLVGNVYCQFRYEEDAGKAVENLNDRFYAGRPLYAELSPVTDFREACCRQNEIAECNRGGFCNFMHLKHPSRSLKRELQEAQRLSVREKRRQRDEEERRRRSEERRRHEGDERPPSHHHSEERPPSHHHSEERPPSHHHSEERPPSHHHSEERPPSHHHSEERHHHSEERHHHSEERHHHSEERHHHSEERHLG